MGCFVVSVLDLVFGEGPTALIFVVLVWVLPRLAIALFVIWRVPADKMAEVFRALAGFFRIRF